MRAHEPPQHRIYHAFSSIFDQFLGKYEDFEISKSKKYFFGEKKNHSDQKKLKNQQNSEFRYSQVPSLLSNSSGARRYSAEKNFFFRIWSAPGAGPLKHQDTDRIIRNTGVSTIFPVDSVRAFISRRIAMEMTLLSNLSPYSLISWLQ